MPTSSLGSITRLLNRHSVKAMAAALSMPPPVSARRLLERAPFNLLPRWELVTEEGISVDLPNSVWHAGHVEDAYSIDGHRILLASQTGGVWLTSAAAQFAPIPLSNFWQQVDISCLGVGARGPKHVYAGGQGSALYETATSSLRAVASFEGLKSVRAIASKLHQGVPISLRRLLEIDSDAALFDWRQIRVVNPEGLPLSVTINQLVVVTGVGPAKLVLATSGGLYWSDVPNLGGTYRFSLAVGIPSTQCLAVALAARTPGQNTSVVCSPTGAVSSPQSNGLYVGTWQAGQLVMQRAQHLGDVDFVQWHFAVVASCDGDRSRLYAAISASGTATLSLRRALGKAGLVQPDLRAKRLAQKLGVSPVGSLDKLLRTADPQKIFDQLYAVLSSRDGGASWAPAGPHQIVEESVRLERDPGATQGGYNISLAVSPSDPNTIALGWRIGPWIGRNTPKELAWEQHGDLPDKPGFSKHIHADSHGLHFDPHDPAGKTLLVCSDGGFIFSRDLCATFDSSVNRLLPNLQFQSYPSQFGGSSGAAGVSMVTPRLVSGPLQDNGVVFSAATGEAQSPWKRITVTDDGLLGIMLTNDTALFNNNDDPTPRTARWNGGGFDAEVKLPVRTASPTIAAGAFLSSPFVEPVFHPAFRRPSSSQLMYAIATCDGAGTARELWGLSADADGGNAGWDFLVKLSANATAAASDDGNTVLIGMANGGIFTYDSRTGGLAAMTLDPSIAVPAGQVYQFSYLNSGVAIARFQSTLLRLDPATGRWTTMGGNGMPLNEGGMHFTAVDTGRSPTILYLATDFGVHATWDAGANWLPVSQGLPLHSHPSTLRTNTEPDSSRRLYLFTYGRSAWRARLN